MHRFTFTVETDADDAEAVADRIKAALVEAPDIKSVELTHLDVELVAGGFERIW